MTVAPPDDLAGVPAENTNRHLPSGSAFLLTDQLEPAHNRVRASNSIRFGAQSGRSPRRLSQRKPKAEGLWQLAKSVGYPISADKCRRYAARRCGVEEGASPNRRSRRSGKTHTGSRFQSVSLRQPRPTRREKREPGRSRAPLDLRFAGLWRRVSVAAVAWENAFRLYLPAPRAAIALSIASLTDSILKLAPRCIGGNSIRLCAALATSC
jgi:hypothetical protein